MSYDDYQALEISRNGKILTITLNQPDTRNAVTEAMSNELSEIFVDVDRDPDTDVVVLTGAGTTFCGGGDISWMQDMLGDPVKWANTIRRDRRIMNSLLDLEKPMIARVVGPAIGLGASLALFSDFVYATPDARFADPHVSVGLVAGDGGAVLWPALIGYARAKRYLLTGDFITGADAANIGLITEAVPADSLDDTVDQMAERLASGATHAIRWTKASVNAGLKQVANAVMDRAAGFEYASAMLDDHSIAVEAFLNKSKPEFTGR